jgi:hypothetical protein
VVASFTFIFLSRNDPLLINYVLCCALLSCLVLFSPVMSCLAQLMSSYYFTDTDAGPPGVGVNNGDNCGNGRDWVSE